MGVGSGAGDEMNGGGGGILYFLHSFVPWWNMDVRLMKVWELSGLSLELPGPVWQGFPPFTRVEAVLLPAAHRQPPQPLLLPSLRSQRWPLLNPRPSGPCRVAQGLLENGVL